MYALHELRVRVADCLEIGKIEDLVKSLNSCFRWGGFVPEPRIHSDIDLYHQASRHRIADPNMADLVEKVRFVYEG